MDKTTEQLFTALKKDNDQLREEMREGFKAVEDNLFEMKKTLKAILDIVQTYDVERKEIKSTLWEYERRIRRLEGKPA
jgi:hypothetical protein